MNDSVKTLEVDIFTFGMPRDFDVGHKHTPEAAETRANVIGTFTRTGATIGGEILAGVVD